MSQKPIVDIAEGFGLSVESLPIPDHEPAFRVYKGARQIFVGTEAAVRDFFVTYKKELPTGPLIKNTRGLKE